MSTGYPIILIAVDSSDDADQVLDTATALHRQGGEGYHVVTVIPPLLAGLNGMGPGAFAAAWPLREMEEALTREITDSVRERVARYGIPPERVKVLFGRPATEIAAWARELGAALIVLGSHSGGALARVLLGSTANGVLHAASCDVLVVRIK